MNYIILSTLFFVVFLYWNTIIVSQVGTQIFYLSVYQNACLLIQHHTTPEFAILRKQYSDAFSTKIVEYNNTFCGGVSPSGKWELLERPIVGDHIHLEIAIQVNDISYQFHDRNMSQQIPYEYDGYYPSCPNTGKFAYEKRWYHTGVHTHCDGIVHVHPWSAPYELRVEGKEVKLKLWFESVGIEVAPDLSGLKLPGQHDYIHNWRLAYFIHVNDNEPAYITNDINLIQNIWLVDHHGGIALWSGNSRPEFTGKVLQYKKVPKNYPSRKI